MTRIERRMRQMEVRMASKDAMLETILSALREANIMPPEGANIGREAASSRKTRHRAAKPSDSAVAESICLWSEYHDLAGQMYGRGSHRASKSAFAERHRFAEREFRRAFSYADKRGLGSAPRARYNAEIIASTVTLREALKESHGKGSESPLFRLKRAV